MEYKLYHEAGVVLVEKTLIGAEMRGPDGASETDNELLQRQE